MARLIPDFSVHGDDHVTVRIKPGSHKGATWLTVTLLDGEGSSLFKVDIFGHDERGVTVEDLRPAPLMASMTEAAE